MTTNNSTFVSVQRAVTKNSNGIIIFFICALHPKRYRKVKLVQLLY